MGKHSVNTDSVVSLQDEGKCICVLANRFPPGQGGNNDVYCPPGSGDGQCTRCGKKPDFPSMADDGNCWSTTQSSECACEAASNPPLKKEYVSGGTSQADSYS